MISQRNVAVPLHHCFSQGVGNSSLGPRVLCSEFYGPSVVWSQCSVVPVFYGPGVRTSQFFRTFRCAHHCQLFLLVLLHPPHDARQLFCVIAAAQESLLPRKEEGGRKKCESHQESAERKLKKMKNSGWRNQATLRTHRQQTVNFCGFGSSLLREEYKRKAKSKGRASGASKANRQRANRLKHDRHGRRGAARKIRPGPHFPVLHRLRRRAVETTFREEENGKNSRHSPNRFLGWEWFVLSVRAMITPRTKNKATK